VKGVGSEDSIGTYYKYFRLACESATSRKMGNGSRGFDRIVHRVSQLLRSPLIRTMPGLLIIAG